MCGRSEAGMPMPWSSTENAAKSPSAVWSRQAETRIFVPSGLYLMALLRRLPTSGSMQQGHQVEPGSLRDEIHASLEMHQVDLVVDNSAHPQCRAIHTLQLPLD